MQDVAQLIDEQLLDHFAIRRFGTFGVDGGAVGHGLPDLVECGSVNVFPVAALIPRTTRVNFAVVALAGAIIEELVDQSRRRRNFADRKARLAHAFESRSERLHVGDFARHQELQCVAGADILAEIDQPLVHNLRAGFGRDIAAKVDIEFAGDLEVVAVHALPTS